MARTELRERILMGELHQQGKTDREIAQRLGWKKETVRKWRRKWQKAGKDGLAVVQGRPKCGAMSAFPATIRDQLMRWREAHPRWGPKTLWCELARHPAFEGQPLPSQATIARWLKAMGKVKRYEKRGELPKDLSPTQACHEEWEMDARGQERIEGLGLISLIQVNDVYSRAKLISYPFLAGQTHLECYPKMADYQLVLRRAFTEWGLPDRLAVDHAHVFYDAQGKSPFPTQFHLWLLALGIRLTFGRTGQPRDQGMTERSHQTWWEQVVFGQHFDHLESLWQALETRRPFLNETLPCATLGDLAPLVAFPEARIPRRPYRPEWEMDLLDLQRVYAYLSACHWYRKVSKVGTVSLGQHNYTLGKEWYLAEVEVNFDLETLCFLFHAPPRPDKRLPIRWLTKVSLMGDLVPLACFSELQLLLPFAFEDWRSQLIARLFDR